MKVLFYNHTGTVSGAERVLLLILGRVHRDRFEPVVVCPSNGRMMEMTRALRIRTRGLPQLEARFTWRVDRMVRYLVSFAGVIRSARNVVKDEAPDAIHANSIRAGLVMSAATMGLHVPVIWHAHDILPRHPFSVVIRFFACASARNSILAVSEAVADRFHGILIGRFGRRVPVRVIQNGVDLERFQPNSESRKEIRRALGLTERQPVIGIVGHLTPNKGQLELIEAFAAISRETSDAILLVVGEALFNRGKDYAESLVRAANSLGVADRIRFLGFREDVPAIMQGLDLLVVNSRTEAFPLTVLEGLASGTPVLATAVGGTPEMIRHGQNGWLVKPRDQDAFGKALLTLLRDPSLRAELGRNGRLEAVARFSIERLLGEVESLYRGVFSRGVMPQRNEKARKLEANLSPD